MRRLSLLIAIMALGSCSTSSYPKSYKTQTPTKKLNDLYHETVGLVVSYKKTNSFHFQLPSIFPLSKSFLNTIHEPIHIQKKKPLQELFTKNVGHERYIKFFLPAKLKSVVTKLNSKSSFPFEVVSKRGRQLYQCTKLTIKEEIKKNNLLEVHLSINDIDAPLTPSEAILFKLPIGQETQTVIPEEALQSSTFSPFVYIINKEGKMEKRKVRVAGKHDHSIAIVEGLSDNPTIAIPE